MRCDMIVMSRTLDQAIIISDDIKVKVKSINESTGEVELEIEAPEKTQIVTEPPTKPKMVAGE